MKKLLILLSTILIVLIANANPPKGGHKAAQKGSLNVHFKNVVDDKDLRLNDSISFYKNANGDDFKITTFKYYISNVSLIAKNGQSVAIPDSYFLVNAADSTTLNQQITNIPEGKYTGISFIIGVDSLRNFAGAQTGVLDPAKGMFWSWNSGYIFVKFEGQSSKSTAKKTG